MAIRLIASFLLVTRQAKRPWINSLKMQEDTLWQARISYAVQLSFKIWQNMNTYTKPGSLSLQILTVREFFNFLI